MSQYNTPTSLVYSTKCTLSHFASTLSEGMGKANQKFLLDLCYGMAKSQSVMLTEMARALDEPIDTIQTVKRLSTRMATFNENNQLNANYTQMIQPHLSAQPLVLVDQSEIVKPAAQKMEGLGQVHDGSTHRIDPGYWTTNMITVTGKTKHPLSLYSQLYSASETGFISANEETSKGLRYVNHMLGDKRATFVMDRGYDTVSVMKTVLKQSDDFIIRLKKNRHLLFQNRKWRVADLAVRRKGKINFNSKIKGVRYDLKVSHVPVRLPSMKRIPMTMVVVHGYGKSPMVLLTNQTVASKSDVLAILKAYTTRWRIEKQNAYFYRVIEQARGIKSADDIKMFLYRFFSGIKAVLNTARAGIRHFKNIEHRKDPFQLAFTL